MAGQKPDDGARDDIEDDVDYIVRHEGGGDWRRAIRSLLLYVRVLQAKLQRLQQGEQRGFGGMLVSELDRKISTIEFSTICTQCPSCLRRTAQPPDIVKSSTSDRELTLRVWAERQRCRCGQLGVGVVLRDKREARNWMLER
ncbi:MAG: hypothetical protein K0R27_1476 [Xanthobacteraceae bacterium]|jgi:plasmid stabilization system protein ParE|nr:hypothetical protein [Xanthobacteraceae bacterium]